MANSIAPQTIAAAIADNDATMATAEMIPDAAVRNRILSALADTMLALDHLKYALEAAPRDDIETAAVEMFYRLQSGGNSAYDAARGIAALIANGYKPGTEEEMNADDAARGL